MINSIGFYDVYFIFESSIQALLKIHKFAIDFNHDEIEIFLNRNILVTERIDFNQFKSLISICEEINSIFKYLGLEGFTKSNERFLKVKIS